VGYSRFYLCDLQVHTPADPQQGYGDVGGREPNEAFARRLVEAHASAGVRVMAVSDHNRVDWYPMLRSAGEAVGVYVFPALEFSVNRCHLLAVWDRTVQGYELAQRFLATMWDPGVDPFDANGDPRPVSKGQVGELAKRANDHKALVFAPHATAKNIGMLASGVCTNRKEVIATGCIAGFDVWGNSKADVLSNSASDFTDRSPRWFISGDVRSFDVVGKRAVYLKLGEEPTLEGLRQAFLMHETRIRFPEQLQAQWGHVRSARFISSVEPSWPRFTNITVDGGFHDGLVVSFAPGLNAIIGGKGTGKSTLIEILRHVIHPERATGEAHGNRKHNFRANAEAVVSFLDATGDHYEVRRSGSEDPAQLLRDGVELSVDVAKRVSTRIFGQRELQELASRPEALRSFVAAEAGEAWTEALASERTLLDAISLTDSALERAEAVMSRLEEDQQELADVTDKIDNAIARGVGEHAERLATLAAAHQQVDSVLRWPAKVGAALQELSSLLPPPSVPELPGERNQMRTAVHQLGEQVRSATAGLDTAITTAEVALRPAAAAWQQQHKEQRAQIERELADAGLTDPRDLAKLQRQDRDLRERLGGLPEQREKTDAAALARSQALTDLSGMRRRKSRLIEQAAKRLDTSVGARVRIRVDPLSDKSQLLEALEASVRGQSVRSDQLTKLATAHTPTGIAAAIREGQAKLEGLGCSSAAASKLCAANPGSIRRIEEADTPDRIVVEVNLAEPGGEEAWQDVVEVSPGQRATALLALALAGGQEPLIIDQPEDDLDNRYIYDEVVKVLADVCQRRQVIVATHNANIPILGDAEMVLALDAQAARGRVLATGGLEDPNVAEWARKILEGGEAAFQARHRRYQAAVAEGSV